ncbi:hypothetical protein GCM10009000_081440 [Halobacterium noricense]|uniref:Uncharacterized protein n=1 Tax=Haladaptatus pallidirubidus TaxID=1008152 RepID=A0AAV3UIT4_9EURY
MLVSIQRGRGGQKSTCEKDRDLERRNGDKRRKRLTSKSKENQSDNPETECCSEVQYLDYECHAERLIPICAHFR